MTYHWLHLRLSAPLMAFGGVTIDQVGPTRDYPAASALTGLLANALGWRREATEMHQSLQNRLIFGALTVRQGRRLLTDTQNAKLEKATLDAIDIALRLTDTQNAKLEKTDRGWTTWGMPEGRQGATYDSPHRRSRDYLADHECRVVLRLNPSDDPSLDDLADALVRPARPLFMGRKPCLPATPVLVGRVEGKTVYAALCALGVKGRALWPDEGVDSPKEAQHRTLADLRNWRTGLHGGNRTVITGEINT